MSLKILYVVPYVPNLIRVRPYNLIRYLSERGNEVTLVTLWTSPEEREDIELIRPYCHDLHAFELPKWRSYWNCLAALPTPHPLQAVYCWQPDAARKIRSILEENDFDVIHIEHLRGARYGLDLRSELEGTGKALPPIVWDSVDNISHLFRQASQESRAIFSRLVTRLELGKTEWFEARLMHEFERTTVTSPVDKEAFLALDRRRADPERIFVLQNGVDLAYFAPDADVARELETLVVSGKLSYHANVSMVLYLVREIMPLIWEEKPDVKLVIVGKDPAKEIQALGERPRITVTGTVDDIRPYLQRATAAVTPIVYGAGIQNKVLEAMACGTPVVSTPKAVSALSALPGEDLLVAQDPPAFARTVLDLLDDPEQQERLSAAGRRYVEDHHHWNVIAGHLEDVYRQAGQKTQVDLKL